MQVEVLPLAITMMVGPQIMSAIIFVTTGRPIQTSLVFIAGVGVATTVGVAIALGLQELFDISLGGSDSSTSSGNVVQYVLIGLLVLAALKNWRGRETVEPPKWLGTLMNADWKQGLKVGLLVILLMPSDIIIMLTVATNLAQNGGSLADALPFVGATVLIGALPLIVYIVFHRRAVRAMPKVRDWMNANSWLVNIIVCGIFILLIAG
jgi:hypothetical protein